MNNHPKIFVHIGLSKTGSSYLQKEIFPNFNNCVFHHSHDDYTTRIAKTTQAAQKNTQSILFSGEWYSGNLRDFHFQTPDYKNTTFRESISKSIDNLIDQGLDMEIIIFFRSHEKYILSCYKHYLKYKGHKQFKKYYSLSGKNTLIGFNDVCYRDTIEYIIQKHNKTPHIFDLDDFMIDLEKGVNRLENILDASFTGELNSKKIVNRGANAIQAKNLAKVNSYRKQFMRTRFTTKLYEIAKVTGLWPSYRDIISKDKNGPEISFPHDILIESSEAMEKDWIYVQELVKQQENEINL